MNDPWVWIVSNPSLIPINIRFINPYIELLFFHFWYAWLLHSFLLSFYIGILYQHDRLDMETQSSVYIYVWSKLQWCLITMLIMNTSYHLSRLSLISQGKLRCLQNIFLNMTCYVVLLIQDTWIPRVTCTASVWFCLRC